MVLNVLQSQFFLWNSYFCNNPSFFIPGSIYCEWIYYVPDVYIVLENKEEKVKYSS